MEVTTIHLSQLWLGRSAFKSPRFKPSKRSSGSSRSTSPEKRRPETPEMLKGASPKPGKTARVTHQRVRLNRNQRGSPDMAPNDSIILGETCERFQGGWEWLEPYRHCRVDERHENKKIYPIQSMLYAHLFFQIHVLDSQLSYTSNFHHLKSAQASRQQRGPHVVKAPLSTSAPPADAVQGCSESLILRIPWWVSYQVLGAVTSHQTYRLQHSHHQTYRLQHQTYRLQTITGNKFTKHLLWWWSWARSPRFP